MRIATKLSLLPLCLPLLLLGPLGACGEANPVAPPFTVRGSVNQIFVTHAPPATELAAVDDSGKEQGRGTTDTLGSLIFRKLPAGAAYTVRTTTAMPALQVDQIKVVTPEASLPPATFYSAQKLVPGLNYIVTRDGTTLSAFVALPGAPEDGPYPTLVNYSGYDPSRPDSPIKGFEFLCKSYPVICDPPSDATGLIGALFGYATVSVNIRGTGCSGGAYDYFETLESLDGYDVIETVAAQPWVSFHKVGMTGLSYPGIAQFFVAKARPPSLAAITPMSVIGNVATTLFPGGLLNDGFAIEWVTRVVDRAGPYGQGWEQGRVDGGDLECKENQLLHGQKVDNVKQARETPYYDPALIDPLNPTVWANTINVPVFLTGAWQDEQTGPFFTTLLDKFTGSPQARFTMFNGLHPDGFAPQVIAEWKAFLDLYVAHKKPGFSKGQRELAPSLFQQVFKTSMALPDDRWAQFTGYDDALAAYQKEPPVRVIFEDGTGTGGNALGAPEGAFDMKFPAWPVGKPKRLYLHAGTPAIGGLLADTAPAEPTASSQFVHDPDAGHRTNLQKGADPWDLLPRWDWKPVADGKVVAFATPPLAEDLLLLGTSSVDLWVKSSAEDADLQVVLSELRDDGKEVFIQAGWLRASYRKLGPDATELWPAQSFLQGDIASLKAGEWTSMRLAVPAVGHVLRKGSRLRVAIDTPGGARSEWLFALKPFASPPTYTIGHDATHPSSINLSVLPGYTATTPAPPCPSLRGQPCRDIAKITNQAGM